MLQQAQTAFQWKKADVKGNLTVATPKHLILTNTKEAEDFRAEERLKFGIGRDFKKIKKTEFNPDIQVIDPAYAASLGVTELGWEQEL
jgi:hypothetical protein